MPENFISSEIRQAEKSVAHFRTSLKFGLNMYSECSSDKILDQICI